MGVLSFLIEDGLSSKGFVLNLLWKQPVQSNLCTNTARWGQLQTLKLLFSPYLAGESKKAGEGLCLKTFNIPGLLEETVGYVSINET